MKTKYFTPGDKAIKMKAILGVPKEIATNNFYEVYSKGTKISFTKNSCQGLSCLLLFLPILLMSFSFLLIISKAFQEKEWLIILLSPVITINVWYLDFALRNYFGGKRKLIIWISELVLSMLIIYLFI